jgi:hypothetical protein
MRADKKCNEIVAFYLLPGIPRRECARFPPLSISRACSANAMNAVPAGPPPEPKLARGARFYL